MTAGTRDTILAAALRLFVRQGYAETTMRAIAIEAGVVPSHAYYYFRSKDELITELYRKVQLDHHERVADTLAGRGSLGLRLHTVVHAGLDVMAAYHDFGGAFVTAALRPDAPTNPFRAEPTPVVNSARAVFQELVSGADPAVPGRIVRELPDLLWLCYLAVLLFWVTDDSPRQRRTRELVDAVIPLVLGLVKLARLPMTGPVITQLGTILAVLAPRAD